MPSKERSSHNRAGITEILNPPISRELMARVRSLYDGLVRIIITPAWAKLIDFETTLPSAVEEPVRERAERQHAERQHA